MSNSKATIALNIGSQRISMGVFHPSKKGGLILKGYDSISILADPLSAASRPALVCKAVAQLAKSLKVSKGSKLSYTISGKSVFTRFIKLPPIESDDLAQLVAFEAQQHIPFPLEEVVWDWTELESLAGEKEVAIVAIRREALNEVNEAVTGSGLGTDEVDASPMSLYSALRYNYPNLAEPTLLVDIGAKTCNLVYTDGPRMFTRSLNIGGAMITSAIGKDYGVSFEDAEKQKCTNGMVVLNSYQTAELDESIAALATVIRNALGKLPSDISRTTNYFRSQHSISAPKRVLLAGGGANLTFIADFLQEKLNLPVELFNPMQAVSLSKGVDAEKLSKESHMIGELVGLALRGIDKAALNIDLVSDVVSHERDTLRRKPFLLAASGILLLGLGVWAMSNVMRVKNLEAAHADIDDQMAALAPFSKPLSEISKDEKKLDDLAADLNAAQSSRVLWVDVWSDLSQRFASDVVWLVDFDPVVGFDPEQPLAANTASLQSVITEDFSNTDYGVSSLNKLGVKSSSPKKGKRKSRKVERPGAAPMVNALRVKGFWRGANGHKAVTQLINSLRSDSKFFDVLPSEKIIISLPTRLESGAYAAPFELILPLKKAIPVSQKKG